MGQLVFQAALGGQVNLVGPNTASTLNINVPAANGTMLTTASTGVVTQTMLSTNVAGNGPAFSAYSNAAQTVTTGVYTKIALNIERFDTNNNFDPTTNYRFTPTVAGYYQINYSVYGTSTGTMTAIIGALYKNGSVYEFGVIGTIAGSQLYSASTLVSMNGSTDYLELYINLSGTGTLKAESTGGTVNYMSGSLVRSA